MEQLEIKLLRDIRESYRSAADSLLKGNRHRASIYICLAIQKSTELLIAMRETEKDGRQSGEISFRNTVKTGHS